MVQLRFLFYSILKGRASRTTVVELHDTILIDFLELESMHYNNNSSRTKLIQHCLSPSVMTDATNHFLALKSLDTSRNESHECR